MISNPQLNSLNGDGDARVSKDDFTEFWKDHVEALKGPDPPPPIVLFLENLDEEWGDDWFERDAPKWEFTAAKGC